MLFLRLGLFLPEVTVDWVLEVTSEFLFDDLELFSDGTLDGTLEVTLEFTVEVALDAACDGARDCRLDPVRDPC